MKGKIYLYIILAIIVGSVALIVLDPFKGGNASGQTTKSKDEVILFWGEGCPHCKNVEDYLASHKEIEEKIKIERKEVGENVTNSIELTDRAKDCKIDVKNGVAVPFLFYKGECITGDQPIIDYLTKKAQ